MLRNVLPLIVMLAAASTALAQGTPTRPPFTPPPTTAQTGELQGRPIPATDPTQVVTLDTNEVKLRVDPTRPLPAKAPTRPRPKAKPRP